MEALAKAKYVRIAPRKVRLVVDMVRGKPVSEALDTLRLVHKAASPQLAKVIRSAVANAENNHDLDVDRLYVAEATVGKAIVMKRWRARARGRMAPVHKPFSNLRVVVREREEQL